MSSRVASPRDPSLPDPGGPRRGRGRKRFLGLVGSLLVLALLVGIARVSVLSPDPADLARSDADAAVSALREGDVAALDLQLSANRASPTFAYYFTSQATPRDLGDALATIADSNHRAAVAARRAARADPTETQAVETGLDAAYERTLTDLADVLALATRGTDDLTLPTSWTNDFTTYTTTQLRDNESSDPTERVAQDMANKQNLLLLLSRGRWSTDFLKATTEAYWDWEHNLTSSGDLSPWPVDTLANARFAPAPNGTYLTDGMVALMAALTANPEAAGWAFADFQPSTTTLTYGDADHPMGSFAHYLFFERPSAQTVSQTSGMTASVTALMSAIQATGGSYSDQAVGPMADLFVLQGYLDAMAAEQDPGPWYAKWLARGVHLLLDTISFIPGVGTVSASISAAWSAYERDWTSAGLSLGGMLPFVGVVSAAGKLVKAAKTGKLLRQGVTVTKLVDHVGGVIDETTDAGKLLTKAVGVDDGIYDFDNAGAFLAALKNPIPGVTYKYGDTTYELAPDGKTLTHVSGPDKNIIERGSPKQPLPGRNEKGHFTSDPAARAAAKVKEEQGLKDYEAANGVTVLRTQAQAHVDGVENPRFYDGLARKRDGTYVGIEVKSGEATRSVNQEAFDGLVSVKNPATATLRTGETIRITSVAFVRVD